MALKDVIELWNPWLSTGEMPSSFIGEKRDILEDIGSWMDKRMIKVIVGPRRAGKTTVMYQLIEHIINTKKDPTKAIYVNFEDPELREAGFKKVYEEIKKIGGRGVYLFLDEVQNIRDWESFIRTYYDRRDHVNFILSGSTLAMMGKSFQKKLAGRAIVFNVFPFSIDEAMRIRGITKDPRDKDMFFGLIEELLLTGSYPEIFLEKDPQRKKRLLLEYYESIIARDVAAAYDLDIDRAQEIAYYLLRNVSSKTSVNQLAKMFKVSYHTAERYLNAFKDSMIFFDVRRFSFSLKEQMAFPRKIYPYDLGFRWAVGKGHSRDIGRLFESFIASEFVKKGKKIYYWQGKNECDFVISDNGSPKVALQVSWQLNNKNKEREEKGLNEALRALKIKEGAILTKDNLSLFLKVLTNFAKVFK